MSALKDINDLDEVGEKIGRNQQQQRQQQQPSQDAAPDGVGRHLLLAASQKAVRELASALEHDSDG